MQKSHKTLNIVATFVVSLVAFLPLSSHAQAGAIALASYSPTGGFFTEAQNTPAGMSDDGRYVAFTAAVGIDYWGSTMWGAFLRDTQLGQTIRLDAPQSSTTPLNPGAWAQSISSDGRYVLFTSNEAGLDPLHTANIHDLYLYDAVNKTRSLISTNSAGAESNGDTSHATISADGRFVVFDSTATNYVPGDTNGHQDVYAKDFSNGTVSRVSITGSGIEPNNDSFFPSISNDGRYVAFSSYATNLAPGIPNNIRDVYLKDLNTGSLTLVSNSSTGPNGSVAYNLTSIGRAISGDGRYIVYESNATNLTTTNTAGHANIYLYDSSTGVTTLITQHSGVSGNADSVHPSISNDGSSIILISYATNLIENYFTQYNNALVWSRATNQFVVASSDASGNQANNYTAGYPGLSGSAKYALFMSTASNLIPNYSNNDSHDDVYTKELATDTTSPSVLGTPGSQANANGWYNNDVMINWTATDPDGTATTPAPTSASTEGANVNYTSGQSCDPSGNCATGTLALSIDKTAPTINYSVSPSPDANGWNTSDVTVTFSCADALSGVDTCTAPVTVSADTAGQQVTGTAVDKAGNTDTVTATVKLDKTAPTINYTLSQAPNTNGWNNQDVVVTFNCSDATSGVSTCSSPVTVGEGANQIVTGTSVDNAGNTTTTSVTLNVDEGKPTIAYAVTPVSPNSAGWYNGDVTVNFSCLDALSGVAACSPPVTLSSDGANQTAFGSAEDLAGNTQTVSVSGLNIDKTLPVTTNPSFGTNAAPVNTNVTLTATVNDATSGVVKAQYYVGSDPVGGTWTDMTLNGSVASATINTGATPAMYSYYVRSVDAAGNVGAYAQVNLDVYSTSSGQTAGHGFVIPGSATSDPGDFIPTESGPNVTATFDFSVKYASATDTTPSGSSTFTYGSNCNTPRGASQCFMLNFDSFGWLVVPGDSTATYQGLATLTLNGQNQGSNYPVRVTVFDGGLTGVADHYEIQVYPVGSDPDFASPLYQASGDVTGGNVVLHP